MIDFQDPQVLMVGGALALGGIVWWKFRQGSSSDDSGEVVGPSYVSYVSPGSPNAVYTDPASTISPGSSSNTSALVTAQAHSDDTNLSALNSDSLLTQVANAVNYQVSKLPFKTDYGFHSSVQGSLTLNGAGSPSFSLTTDFAPKKASNLQMTNANLTRQLKIATDNYNALKKRTVDLKAGKKP